MNKEEKIKYITEQIELANKSLQEGLTDSRSKAIENVFKYINDEDIKEQYIELIGAIDIDVSDAFIIDSPESYERFKKKMIDEGVWDV